MYRSHNLFEQVESLRVHFFGQRIDAGNIAARPRQGPGQAGGDRVIYHPPYDGHGFRHARGRNNRRLAGGNDDSNAGAEQLCGKSGQLTLVAIGVSFFKQVVAPLNKAMRTHTLSECLQLTRGMPRPLNFEPADPYCVRRRLLRTPSERPRDRRAAKQRDELPPPHVRHGASRLGVTTSNSRSHAAARSACHSVAGRSLRQT